MRFSRDLRVAAVEGDRGECKEGFVDVVVQGIVDDMKVMNGV